MQGKIIKGIAGVYYVDAEDGRLYECKAKGIFRKEQQKPMVGDNVAIEILSSENKEGIIYQINQRKSELIRPPVANVDQALIIFSAVKPQPNFNLLDRFLIMMKQQELPCIICINKVDLDDENSAEEYEEIYRACGYQTVVTSADSGEGIAELKSMLIGKTTTVAGPSGVGKSSIINCLQSNIRMNTGSISTKIERGKHTTRHCELIAIEENTYILDTPGFSSLGLFDLEKEELAAFYPEFTTFEKNCKFGGCSHIAEPVCGIKEALKEKKINKMRYDNYVLLYEELRSKRNGKY